jgi:hypothetical protein
VLHFYEYSVPQCGTDAVIRLPKSIRVHITNPDDVNVGNYLALYEVNSNEFLLTFKFKQPDNVAYVGSFVKITDLNIPVSVSDVFFLHSGVVANTTQTRGAVLLHMKDGKSVAIGPDASYIFSHADCKRNTGRDQWVFPYTVLSYCGYSISDVDYIAGVGALKSADLLLVVQSRS